MSAVDDAVQQLSDATDTIAQELTDLRGQISSSDAGAAAKLDPIIQRLQDLGKDPNNPVPEPTPAT